MTTPGQGRESVGEAAQASAASGPGAVPSFTAGQVALYAAGVAIIAGLLEAGIQLLVTKGMFHRPIRGDVRLFWMSPAGYSLTMFAPAALLALLARRIPRVVILSILISLGAIGVVALQPNLHWWATLLLAAGLAIAATRSLARRPLAADRMVRRFVPLAALLLVFFGVGHEVWRRYTEARVASALPPQGSPRRNVLLIVWDTVRETELSLYGYQRQTTPDLARFAHDAVVFDRAFAPSSWTLPSHASMFTGRLQQELVADLRTPLDRTHPTLAEVLGQRGYRTAGFVANVVYAGVETGVDRGFSHFEGVVVTGGTLLRACSLVRWMLQRRVVARNADFVDHLDRKMASRINRDFLAWLDGTDGQPWFAFLNYFDAHYPYRSPPPFDTAFGADPRRPPLVFLSGNSRQLSKKRIAQEHDAYDAAIRYLDAQTSELMAELARRNLLDNTIVIITSDHGEQFGEHERLSHGNSLYRQLLGVPLVIRAPGIAPPGVHVARPVGTRSIPATIMDLVGFDDPHPFPGSSLARAWSAPDGDGEEDFVESGFRRGGKWDAHAVIGDGLYFIDNSNRKFEMYDFANDVEQTVNLLSSSNPIPVPERILRRRDSLEALARTRGPIR